MCEARSFRTYQSYRDNIMTFFRVGYEQGLSACDMPFVSAAGRQYSVKMKRPYHGLNAFLLGAISESRGYADNRWITEAQAHQLGRWLIPGAEKFGVSVFYPVSADITMPDGTVEKRFRGYREYVVYNASLLNRPLPHEDFEEGNVDELIKSSPAPVFFFGRDAYYRKSDDYIVLPKRRSFSSTAAYYGALLRQMVSSTKTKERCDRENNYFFSNSYSAEEMICEIGTALLGARLNLPVRIKTCAGKTTELSSWLSQCDPSEFSVVLTKATEAADYLYNLYRERKVSYA